MQIDFFVPGKPEPGGSKTAFYNRKIGRALMVDANKNVGAWKQTVKVFAMKAYAGVPFIGPLNVECTFHVQRPAGHYGTGKNADSVKPSAPTYPVVKPDATKLWRSTEDALTGILWRDDAQIVDQLICKRYGDNPGAYIIVRTLDEA